MNFNIYYFGSREDNFRKHRIHQKIVSLRSSIQSQHSNLVSSLQHKSCPKTESVKSCIDTHQKVSKNKRMQIKLKISKMNTNNKSIIANKQQHIGNKLLAQSIVNSANKTVFNRVEQAKTPKIAPQKVAIKQNNTANVQKLEIPTIRFTLKTNSPALKDLSVPSYVNSLYKIQPLDLLFLCNTCLQFFPVIQIRNHYRNCFSPKIQSDFIYQWQKIIDLIKQISLADTNKNQILSELANLMQEYISRGQFTKDQNTSLYSNQLTCILSYKSRISLKFVNSDDLFEVLQKLGDDIEACAAQSSFSIWKLCS